MVTRRTGRVTGWRLAGALPFGRTEKLASETLALPRLRAPPAVTEALRYRRIFG